MHYASRDGTIPPHQDGGEFLKDVVYGANDGIITTFAVVAGVAGAGLDPVIVLLLGGANLFADGFSMAASNYLGSKSEQDFFERERGTEEKELRAFPVEEHAEMHAILLKKGYVREDADQLSALLMKNKEFWLDIKLREELGICYIKGGESPVKAGLATFLAFVGAGAIPLLPYLFWQATDVFMLAVVFTAATLFLVGTLRSHFTGQNWLIEGLEMLFVGGIAAAIAYGVGFAVSGIV